MVKIRRARHQQPQPLLRSESPSAKAALSKRRVLWLLSALFVSSALGLIIFGLFYSDLFLIKEYDLRMVYNEEYIGLLPLPDLNIQTKQYQGDAIFFVSERQIAQEIQDKSLLIKSVAVQKIYPQRLRVEVTMREPIAVLLNTYWEPVHQDEKVAVKNRYLVDEEGVILIQLSGDSPRLNLPQLEMESQVRYAVGARIDADLLRAGLAILQEPLFQSALKLRTVRLEEKGWLEIETQDGWRINFSVQNLDKQLHSLQIIANKAKIEGKSVELIDLRYDPAVVRWN